MASAVLRLKAEPNARSATMVEPCPQNIDFGHARGDIVEQVVGFRQPLMAHLKAMLLRYNMNHPQGAQNQIVSNKTSLTANLPQCGAISIPQEPCME